MTEKDLFDAIDNIDPEIIIDAWENSYFETDFTEVPIKTEKRSPLSRTFTVIKYVSAVAAAITLICLGAVAGINIERYISAEPLEKSSKESAAMGDTDSSKSDGAAIGTMQGALPFSIYGPDYVQLNYEDITSVENDGVFFNRDKITDSNWTTIVCEGFAYFAKPVGFDYNSVDFPDSFTDDESHFSERTFTGLNNAVWESVYGKPEPSSSYTRCNIGDNLNIVTGYDNLKLKSAKTVFNNFSSDDLKLSDEDFPTAKLYASSEAEFEGTVNINGMLFKDRDGEIVFIPIGTENLKHLPMMFAVPEYGRDFSSGQTNNCSGIDIFSTDFLPEDRPVYYVSEFPRFYIDFSELYLDSSTSGNEKENVKIENLFTNSNVAHVNLTLDDITMKWSDADPGSDRNTGVTGITAKAVTISRLSDFKEEPYSISDKSELFKYDDPLDIFDDPDICDIQSTTRFCAFESRKYTEDIQTMLKIRGGDVGQGLVYSNEFIDSLTAVIALEWTDKGYSSDSGSEYCMRLYLLAGGTVQLDDSESAYRYAQINLNNIGLTFNFDGLKKIDGGYYSGTYVTSNYDDLISATENLIPSEYLNMVKKMPN